MALGLPFLVFSLWGILVWNFKALQAKYFNDSSYDKYLNYFIKLVITS